MIEKTSRLLRLPLMMPLSPLVDPRILSFGMVGIVGFVVDAFLLTVLTIHLGLDVLPSRTVSFACATLFTWLLNRERSLFPVRRAVGRILVRKSMFFISQSSRSVPL